MSSSAMSRVVCSTWMRERLVSVRRLLALASHLLAPHRHRVNQCEQMLRCNRLTPRQLNGPVFANEQRAELSIADTKPSPKRMRTKFGSAAEPGCDAITDDGNHNHVALGKAPPVGVDDPELPYKAGLSA